MTTMALKNPADADTHPKRWYAVPWSVSLMGGLAVVFLALFYRWVVKQNEFSLNQLEDWGHAYVIPLIAGYLVFRRRKEIAAIAPEAFWPGLAPMLVGIACYLYCLVQVKNHMLQGFGMILTLFGVVLLVLGPRLMRWLFLPIAYLAFTVTISEAIMLTVTFKLQSVAAQGAGIVLSVIGSVGGWFNVEVTGNTLELIERATGEVHPLNVAEACCGMRMVVAFYALGVAVALLACRSWWQRIMLVLLAGPVAVLMNVVRVAVLGLLSLGDANLASGDAHTLIGTLLLIPSLGLFLGVVWVLNRLVKSEEKAEAAPEPGVPAGPRVRASVVRAGVVALVIMGASAAGLGAAIDRLGFHLSKLEINAPGDRKLSSIPTETDGWTRVGTDRTESADVVKVLGTENYINRVYARRPEAGGEPVQLDFHAAYYTGMIDTVPHVPERCFVGGGLQQTTGSQIMPVPMDTRSWVADSTVPESIVESTGEIYTVRLSDLYGSLPGKRVRLPRGVGPDRPFQMRISSYEGPSGQKVFAGYFFIANGGTVASADDVRTLAFDLTNDYAYYLKVQVTSASVDSPEELARVSGELLGELIGEIIRCVPDWTEVQEGLYPPGNPRAAANE